MCSDCCDMYRLRPSSPRTYELPVLAIDQHEANGNNTSRSSLVVVNIFLDISVRDNSWRYQDSHVEARVVGLLMAILCPSYSGVT
jgi:hypothetical protein